MKTRAQMHARRSNALRGAFSGALCVGLATFGLTSFGLTAAWAQPAGAPGSTPASEGTVRPVGGPLRLANPQALVPSRARPNLYTLLLAAALQREVQSDYTPPTGRTGRLRVVLDPTGAVASVDIVTSAGYPALDRAMEAAAARFAPGEKLRLPFPTDPPLAAQATRAGFLVPIKFAGPARPDPSPTAAPASAASTADTSRRPAHPSVPGGHTPASGAIAPKER